jgi:hypothetical protein
MMDASHRAATGMPASLPDELKPAIAPVSTPVLHNWHTRSGVWYSTKAQ